MSDQPTTLRPPEAAGLYDPRDEHDACGVGFVVDIKGRRSHGVVEKGLQVLINLLHRGACGCEANTGDGAGILIQTPDRFLRKIAAPLGHHAARRRSVRHRTRLPAASRRRARAAAAAGRTHRRRGRPAAARLADGADRRRRDRRVRARDEAGHRADLHRRRRRRHGRHAGGPDVRHRRDGGGHGGPTARAPDRPRSSGSCTSSASGSSTRPIGCR